jgi:hypothetical protein
MARAKVLGGSGTRLNVWIDTDADRMLHEMMAEWYPGFAGVQGAVVTRPSSCCTDSFGASSASSASRSGRMRNVFAVPATL